jgi:hypothetical protein
MMSKYIALDLKQPGLDYMRSEFYGWRNKIPPQVGPCFENFTHCLAFVPEGTSLERAMNFKTGEYWNGDDAFIDYLQKVLQGQDKNCLIVIDCLDSPDDNYIDKHQGFFFSGETVYEYLNQNQFTYETIDDKLHLGNYFSKGFVSKVTVDEAEVEKKFVDQSYMDNLIKNISMAFMNVYDAESWLLAF